MVVISIGGVQGTGKTTLANALARRLDAMLLSRRAILEVLATAGPHFSVAGGPDLERIGALAYKVLTALLHEQLEIGHSIVIDCGVGDEQRGQWKRMTQEAGARFFIVDTICSDVELHRERFEARGPTWRGEVGQTWNSLDEVRSHFRVHREALFVADSVLPIGDNVNSILTLMREFG